MTPDALERLCKRLAPELAGGPLYVAFSSTMPPALAVADEYLGVATSRLDLSLREHLKPWRGRGPAILLNDRGIFAEAQDRARAIDELLAQTFAWCLVQITVHELAHVLDRALPYYRAADPKIILPVAEVGACLAKPPETSLLAAVPWLGHGPRWLRAVLHLRHRAERLGYPFSAYNLIDHHRLGLTHADAYRGALGDEPERLRAERFERILAAPLPSAFAALWQQDVEDWRASQQSCVA